MRYKFFTNSIVSKFINAVVYNSLLPYVKTIRSNSYIIQGKTYIHKDKLIKCTKTGLFLPYASDTSNALRVSQSLTVKSSGLTVTSKLNAGDYYTLGYYDLGLISRTMLNRYIPKNDYYDSDTHENLGKYLRTLRDLYDLNLMPLYNCFSYRIVDDIILSRSGYSIGKEKGYKVLAVPIHFNQDYTIAIDCDSEVIMQSVFYNKFGMIRTNVIPEIHYLTDIISEIPTHYTHMEFKKPVIYHLSDTHLSEKYATLCEEYESELYLLIRLPENNNSSIVVLEGDYTQPKRKINPYETPSNEIEDVIMKYNCYTSDLSLLQVNDHNIYPFADRLVEYLLLNVIDSLDTIDKNIGFAQKNIYEKENKVTNIWEDTIRYDAYDKYMSAGTQDNKKKVTKLDILGYIDKDIEKFITSSYSKQRVDNISWAKGGV